MTSSIRAKDVRKSQFNAQTSLLSTDYFDFVRSNQNFRITFADLVTALGVTGSLSSLGEVAAIPVLNVIGSINYIRKIIGGSGVVASVSPSNGIQLDHNFSPDKTGVPVLINETSAVPVIRSLVAGTGITIGGSGNIVQISTSGSPGTTKTIQVFSISDFPAPAAGVITLASDTEYRLMNDVSSANRYILGEGTVLSATDPELITLEYTGAGTMFTATDKNFYFRGLGVKCTSGTAFNIESTSGLHHCELYFTNLNVANVGDFDGMALIEFAFGEWTVSTQGITFTNNITSLAIDTINLTIAAGAGNGINFGAATFDDIYIHRVVFDIDSTGYCIMGAASSANINAGGLGQVLSCKQLGSAGFLNTISVFDNLWEFSHNADVVDSEDAIVAYHGGGTIAIAALGTPVIIGATWTIAEAHRFSGTAGGRFTYNGKGAHVEVSCSISASIAAATDICTYFLYKNGSPIAGAAIKSSFTNGTTTNICLTWSLELANGDYLELWGQNDDTSADLTITNAIVRIN